MSKPRVAFVCLGFALLYHVFSDHGSPPQQVRAGAMPVAVVALPEKTVCEIPFELTKAHYLDPQRQAIESLLRKPISFEFHETPLGEVVRKLQEISHVGIVLNTESVTAEMGSNAFDTPISLTGSDLSLRQALSRILSPLKLVANPKHNEIHIEFLVDSSAALVTKVYPVADLIAFSSDDRIRLARQDLVRFLMVTVQPETWDEVGGPGSIMYEPITMSFVIRQEDLLHDEIENALQTLRAARCRLPKLLHAAGAPSVAEIRKAEELLMRAEKDGQNAKQLEPIQQ